MEEVSLTGQFSYWPHSYISPIYLSVHFMGDLDTSSVVTATWQKDVTFKSGENQQFKEKAWISGKSCGKYATGNVPVEFDSYKVLYTGYYVVSKNLILKHKIDGYFVFCFAVDGKRIKDINSIKGINIGCFQHPSELYIKQIRPAVLRLAVQNFCMASQTGQKWVENIKRQPSCICGGWENYTIVDNNTMR